MGTVFAKNLELSARNELAIDYFRIRSTSLAVCEPLEADDYVVQSMPDASPVKWHLAHTSWFFEQFLLQPYLPGYTVFDPQFDFLFNSYYEAVGPRQRRAQRGLLTRPTLQEICRYRKHVDEHMSRLLDTHNEVPALLSIVRLGLNHEQQHQELIFTDLKHAYSLNPQPPIYAPRDASSVASAEPLRLVQMEGGLREIGSNGRASFCFDNETPRHAVFLAPFALAQRLTSNAEYLDFIRDGGYRRADLWLSDAWAIVQAEQWNRPLYWNEELTAEFTLAGEQALHPHSPVCHLSYYEADAYARWAGMRLPSEAEWEVVAATQSLQGNFLETANLHPVPAASNKSTFAQLFGDVWEWTASPYMAYPRFKPLAGALGEYNGKFMCNQFVLRGGSCVTPQDHIRATYRNFFYPAARWQFSGVRLARDA